MTLNLNCCNDIDGSHFCIIRIHAMIITSCYFVSTSNGSTFLYLVVPFTWLESDVNGMFQCLLAPLQGGYISFDCIHSLLQDQQLEVTKKNKQKCFLLCIYLIIGHVMNDDKCLANLSQAPHELFRLCLAIFTLPNKSVYKQNT